MSNKKIYGHAFFMIFSENGKKEMGASKWGGRNRVAGAERKQFKCPLVATLNAFNLTPDTCHRADTRWGEGKGAGAGASGGGGKRLAVSANVWTDAAMRVDRLRFCRHFKNLNACEWHPKVRYSENHLSVENLYWKKKTGNPQPKGNFPEMLMRCRTQQQRQCLARR